MIGILDYGLGNVKSVLNALRVLGIETQFSSDPTLLSPCDGLIVPGVGAFKTGMHRLQERGLDLFIQRYADSGKPLLGICLGMQLLFESSEEFGVSSGLGLILGQVRSLNQFAGKNTNLRLPHVGWTNLKVNKSNDRSVDLLSEISVDEKFYFVHSFAVQVKDETDILSWSECQSVRFVSAIHKKNIFGVQFHPEKSGVYGLKLLKRFEELTRGTHL